MKSIWILWIILQFLEIHRAAVSKARAEGIQKRPVDSKGLEDYLDDCNNTYLMGERKSFKFISPFFGTGEYPGDVICSWMFVGDKTCTTQLSCKTFDINDSPECEDDYVEVSDGVGGAERFCGTKIFDVALKPSKGQRDLYVTFRTVREGTLRQGFHCEAKCSPPKSDTAQELEVTYEKKLDSRCVCGLQNIDDRIVGGKDATMNEFPWQVAIVFAGTRSPKCGGSIINNQWVLTAAHCFRLDKTEAKDVEVLYHAKSLDMTLQKDWKDVALGVSGSIRGSGYKEKQMSDKDEKTQRFHIIEVITHAKFTSQYDYDVALVKLDRKIDLARTDSPTPICLPDLGYDNAYLGQFPVVVGWGLPDEKAGGTTRFLQKLPVPVLTPGKCQKWTTHQLTQRMICAGYEEGGKDACTGDSGGPLSLKKPNNQWEQIGIVSWGEGCARKQKPGLYSRVTEFLQWIHKHTQGATWCKNSKG